MHASTAGSPTLLLVPTQLELDRVRDLGGLEPGHALQAVCGFGPVAAAARTAQLIERLRPRRAFLVGIAGAYDVERHPVGSALVFGRVAIDGIGAGEGERFVGPPAMGFPQWPGTPETTPEPVHDSLDLWVPETSADALADVSSGGLLLTTCAASDGPEHARERLARHPDALAEDMEGFAVAMACALAGIPLCIVRGVSNEVGDRDGRNWRIPAALAEARRVLLELFEHEVAEPDA